MTERPATPSGFTPVVAYEDSFDALYGLEIDERSWDGEVLRGAVTVRPELMDAHGRLHAGVLAAIAESLASMGTALAVVANGDTASGLSNDTTVVAGISAGRVMAQARALHRADDRWLWSIEMRDQDGELCGFSRVIIAVRPPRPA